MNKLPKIFKNDNINTKINRTYIKEEKQDIDKQIKSIFKNSKNICGVNVEIKINNKIIEEKIIAQTNNYLLTNKNKKIYIKDIQNIVEK